MAQSLSFKQQQFKLKAVFQIARGAKTHADVFTVKIRKDGRTGMGEGVIYPRYESADDIIADLSIASGLIKGGATRQIINEFMKPGAARNAVDSALWALEGYGDCAPVSTMRTISLDTPGAMAQAAAKLTDFTVLKVKLGGPNDIARLWAVHEARPDAQLTIDANEGWSIEDLIRYADDIANCGVVMVEQPLPEGKDSALRDLGLPFKLCADESSHVISDLGRLSQLYDVVNIKLDKTGGLSHALAMKRAAQERGLAVMVGCMVCTGLSIAPAIVLAQDCQFVDLDGPLWLRKNRFDKMVKFERNMVSLRAA